MIAAARTAGISKRELFDDFYWDELMLVFKAMTAKTEGKNETAAKRVSAQDFFAKT